MKILTEVVEEEQFYIKSLANNVIKIVSLTPDIYRKIVSHCKERNIYCHTYRLKEERAFRVVLKHLHYSSNLDVIKQELSSLGHVVRNITIVKHRLTKEPLKILYIDIDPAANNKDIYPIKAIQNKIIQFEPPTQINNTYHSACDVNTTVTRGNTATHPSTALNAEAPTTVRRDQNLENPQPSAPYVVGRTLQTAKDANNIDTYSADTTPTD
jgi:hypothetical protein